MSSAANPDIRKKIFSEALHGFQVTGTISGDCLKFYLEVAEGKAARTEGAKTPSIEELLELLKKHVDPSLIDKRVLSDAADLLKRGELVSARRVAKGVDPQPGKEGKILFLVKPYEKKGGAESVEIVDLKFHRLFDNIEPGDVVARLYPPKAGVNGLDVTGAVLPAPSGKEIAISTDGSLLLRPAADGSSYSELVAQTAGFLTGEGGKFVILSEFVLEGDVDYRCGDIEFVGSVKVLGSVRNTFRVIARGDIVVEGHVQNGRLESAEGSITVKESVIGVSGQSIVASRQLSEKVLEELAASKGVTIKTPKTFEARAVRDISANVGGHIVIEQEVQNCSLRSAGTLIAPRAHVSGGDIHAACGMDVKILGSSSENETHVHFASDIELSPEYSELLSQLQKLETAEDMFNLLLGTYGEQTGKIEELPLKQKNHMEHLLLNRNSVRDRRHECIVKRTELFTQAKFNSVCRANFQKKIYPGVIFHAALDLFRIEQEHDGPGGVEYFVDRKVFEIGKAGPIICDFIVEDGEKKVSKESKN